METHLLRIGNYVLHHDKPLQVKSVFPKGINASTDKTTGKITYIKASEIEPLPLSTDLLRRLGLRLEGTRWIVLRDPLLYVDRARDKFTLDSVEWKPICRLYHVHQLQNIISAGWGIELKFTRR